MPPSYGGECIYVNLFMSFVLVVRILESGAFEGMARAILDGLGFAGVPVDKTITPWPHLLTEWKVSAPFPAEKAPQNAQALTAWHPYDRMKAAAEQPWWDAPFAARGGLMPFPQGKPNVPTVVFGRTWYEAKAGTLAEMQIGGNADRIWVNGELTWESTPALFAGYHPNASRFPICLEKGRNEIVALASYFCFVGVRELSPEGLPR